MAELFRSALSYLGAGSASEGGVGTVAASHSGTTDHNLVGQTVQVGGLKLRIRTLIAEG